MSESERAREREKEREREREGERQRVCACQCVQSGKHTTFLFFSFFKTKNGVCVQGGKLELGAIEECDKGVHVLCPRHAWFIFF